MTGKLYGIALSILLLAEKETAAKKPASKSNIKPASSRRSPVEVIEKEIRDIRKTQKKDMSAIDREQFKKSMPTCKKRGS